MAIRITPGYRAATIGVASAALLIGAFTLGSGLDGASPAAASGGTHVASVANTGRITVTGTGTATGSPSRVSVSMSIKVNATSATSALFQMTRAAHRVTAALHARGVARSAVKIAGLWILPRHEAGVQLPTSYSVGETLTAMLPRLATTGSQIQAAARAGGSNVRVENVSLRLANAQQVDAAARADAVANARAKAVQFARALGEPLGLVISLNTVQQFVGFEPQAANISEKAIAPRISAGSRTVTVSITVVYSI